MRLTIKNKSEKLSVYVFDKVSVQFKNCIE